MSTEPLEIVETADLPDCGHRKHLWCAFPFVGVRAMRACDAPIAIAKDCDVCHDDPPICADCVMAEPSFIKVHDSNTGSCLELHRAIA